MQPSSFQQQPINVQRAFTKTPAFFSSKAFDSSAPIVPQNRSQVYVPNALSKDPETNNQNKSTILSKRDDLLPASYTPKNSNDENPYHNHFSSPPLKFYHSPQLNKNQDILQRHNRGEMPKSLIVEQSEPNQGPSLSQIYRKTADTFKQSPPQRSPPGMNEGYQPVQKNFMDQYHSGNTNHQSEGRQDQNEQSFMIIKKFSNDKNQQKKPRVPAFLVKNTKEINIIKGSSMELNNSFEPNLAQKTLPTINSTMFSLSRSRKKVGAQDFQKMKQLGNGKYGRVYLVREKRTGFICALKVIEKSLLIKQDIIWQFIYKLKIQMFLNHPNIIKLYGYFDDDNNIYIILEVGTGGQLYNFLKKSQQIPEAKVAFLMKQICDAVNQIHSLGIIHWKIKPQNIVLHDNIIKLCGFGESAHIRTELRRSFFGTPSKVCLQILRGNKYAQKIDIWSLGIMMYEMVVGENPFPITKEEELIKIKDEIKIPSHVCVSPEARDFLDKCLQKNRNDRVTIRELVNHPFLKKYPEKQTKSFNL